MAKKSKALPLIILGGIGIGLLAFLMGKKEYTLSSWVSVNGEFINTFSDHDQLKLKWDATGPTGSIVRIIVLDDEIEMRRFDELPLNGSLIRNDNFGVEPILMTENPLTIIFQLIKEDGSVLKENTHTLILEERFIKI